jgi:hypothetical protein
VTGDEGYGHRTKICATVRDNRFVAQQLAFDKKQEMRPLHHGGSDAFVLHLEFYSFLTPTRKQTSQGEHILEISGLVGYD